MYDDHGLKYIEIEKRQREWRKLDLILKLTDKFSKIPVKILTGLCGCVFVWKLTSRL